MSLVSSLHYLLFREAFSNTCLFSVRVISQTNPASTIVGQMTQRLLICCCHATHLLARCDQASDPPARITRRSL